MAAFSQSALVLDYYRNTNVVHILEDVVSGHIATIV
jgi:hypothetical protein